MSHRNRVTATFFAWNSDLKSWQNKICPFYYIFSVGIIIDEVLRIKAADLLLSFFNSFKIKNICQKNPGFIDSGVYLFLNHFSTIWTLCTGETKNSVNLPNEKYSAENVVWQIVKYFASQDDDSIPRSSSPHVNNQFWI